MPICFDRRAIVDNPATTTNFACLLQCPSTLQGNSLLGRPIAYHAVQILLVIWVLMLMLIDLLMVILPKPIVSHAQCSCYCPTNPKKICYSYCIRPHSQFSSSTIIWNAIAENGPISATLMRPGEPVSPSNLLWLATSPLFQNTINSWLRTPCQNNISLPRPESIRYRVFLQNENGHNQNTIMCCY